MARIKNPGWFPNQLFEGIMGKVGEGFVHKFNPTFRIRNHNRGGILFYSTR